MPPDSLPALRERIRARKLVRDLLVDLGDDADGVAGRLGALGVRGIPRRKSECPLARLLTTVVGSNLSVDHVQVWRKWLLVTKTRGWRWAVVRLPAGSRAFVAAFDGGQLPALVQGDPVPPAGMRTSATS